MTKKIIDKYIQFGIDNGYKFHNFQKILEIIFIDNQGNIVIRNSKFQYRVNLYVIITSKEFIEAIARGLNKKFNIKELPTQEQIEELCKTQALFIAGYGGKETFEDFILEITK